MTNVAEPGMLLMTQALSLAGFSAEEVANKAIQMKLRRRLNPARYGWKPKRTPSLPAEITVGESCDVSSITTAASIKKTRRTSHQKQIHDSDTGFSAISSASWSKLPPLPKAAPASSSETPSTTMKRSQAVLDVVEGKKATITIKKTRRTSQPVVVFMQLVAIHLIQTTFSSP
jgi:hypothetical protein